MARAPIAAGQQRPPVSLKVGDTPADRRMVDLAVDQEHPDPMVAPQQGDSTLGFTTWEAKDLHITMQNDSASGSIDWELYLWDDASQLWSQDTTFAVTTGPDEVKRRVVEILGASRAHLRVADSSGGAKANGWVSGNAYA